MNANELADELDDMLKAIGLTDNRVPTMLRQQQAEIEALKANLVDAVNISQKYVDKSKNNRHELTDEEILQTWKEFDDNDADNWFIEIARAILRKAQEK